MKDLHFKSEDSMVDVLFEVYDYGDTKPHDWRITFKTKQAGQLFSNGGKFSRFNREEIKNRFEIEIEDCSYGLTEKDLDKLEKWVVAAKKELARLKEHKKRF